MNWFNRVNTFKQYMSFLLGFIYLWLTLQPAYCLRLRPWQPVNTTWNDWLPRLAIYSFYGTILACLGVMCLLLSTLWPDVGLAFMDAVLKPGLNTVLDGILKLEREHQNALRQVGTALAGEGPSIDATARVFALRQFMRHCNLGGLVDADASSDLQVIGTFFMANQHFRLSLVSKSLLPVVDFTMELRELVFSYNSVAEQLLAAEGENIWERAWDRQGWPATGSYLNPALMLISRRTSTPPPRMVRLADYQRVCGTYLRVSRYFANLEYKVRQQLPEKLQVIRRSIRAHIDQLRLRCTRWAEQGGAEQRAPYQAMIEQLQAMLTDSERLLPDLTTLINSYRYENLISPVGSTAEQLTQWSNRANDALRQAAFRLSDFDDSHATSLWRRLESHVIDLLQELAAPSEAALTWELIES